MKIGVFSDVHGDLLSLQNVWRRFEETGVASETVLNAGDNVGYGKAPVQCIEFMRQHPQIVCVRGNYDKNVADFPARVSEFRKKWRLTRPEKYMALRNDSERISEADREWLLALPRDLMVCVEGFRIFLTHYAPGVKEGITPWTPPARLDDYARAARADVIVCGHTHIPFIKRVGDTLFLNPGNVGRTSGLGASFAYLTLESGQSPTAELFKTA